MSMSLTSSKRLGAIVLVTLVGISSYALAQERRQERHELKTFHPCPRGVCDEVEVRQFVDTDNGDVLHPEFFVDPLPQIPYPDGDQSSRLERLTLDTNGGGVTGRLWIRDRGDVSFRCDHCVHKPDVNRDVVQLRVTGTCPAERQAMQSIDREGHAECVTIIDIN